MDFSQHWMECLDGPFAHWQAESDKKRRNKTEEFCIAMEVVLADPMALRLLPPYWRDYKPVVATAVSGCEDALHFASQRLFNDASLIALCQGDHHDEFCDVLRAVEEEPLELEFLAPAWQNNRTIVAAAVCRKPFAFCFASTRLRSDRALAALSIAHSHNLIGLLALPEHLRKDKELALMVLRIDGMAIALLDSELLPDPEIIATACVKFAAMPYAQHSLQTNEDFVLAIAQKCDPWLIGLHVQCFIHKVDFLVQLINITSERNIAVCRVTSLGGDAVITTFPVNPSICFEEAMPRCLGLDRLFEVVPTTGSFIFNGVARRFTEWLTWSFHTVVSPARELDINVVNEMQIVVHI